MGDDYTTHVVSDKKLPVPPPPLKWGVGTSQPLKIKEACQKIVKNSATDIWPSFLKRRTQKINFPFSGRLKKLLLVSETEMEK